MSFEGSNFNVQKLFPFKTKRNETEQESEFEHNYF